MEYRTSLPSPLQHRQDLADEIHLRNDYLYLLLWGEDGKAVLNRNQSTLITSHTRHALDGHQSLIFADLLSAPQSLLQAELVLVTETTKGGKNT